MKIFLILLILLTKKATTTYGEELKPFQDVSGTVCIVTFYLLFVALFGAAGPSTTLTLLLWETDMTSVSPQWVWENSA